MLKRRYEHSSQVVFSHIAEIQHKVIDTYADEGWEMCGAYNCDDGMGPYVRLFFKRPIDV